MNYALPREDCCPLNYMMAILSGMKIGFKNIPDSQGNQFKQHFEGVRLLESKIIDWLDYL